MGMRHNMENSCTPDHQNGTLREDGTRFGLIVMAAGLSRRFGGNKLLAEFRGRPLAGWIFEALKTSGCAPGAVTVVWHDTGVAALAEAYAFNTCFNPHPEEGQAASIRLGLAASEEADAYVFLTADQPLLRGATLSGMMKSYPAGQGKIMMASYQGNAGNPVIFDRNYKASLMALTGETGGKQILRLHPEAVVWFDIDYAEELMDIDHVEDLTRLSKFRSSDSDRG